MASCKNMKARTILGFENSLSHSCVEVFDNQPSVTLSLPICYILMFIIADFICFMYMCIYVHSTVGPGLTDTVCFNQKCWINQVSDKKGLQNNEYDSTTLSTNSQKRLFQLLVAYYDLDRFQLIRSVK